MIKAWAWAHGLSLLLSACMLDSVSPWPLRVFVVNLICLTGYAYLGGWLES